MEARVDALEKKVEELKMGKLHVKKEKGTRKPSPYNNLCHLNLQNLEFHTQNCLTEKNLSLRHLVMGQQKNQVNKL